MDLHQLWTILSTPDNVPIVLLLFVVPFYTWYGSVSYTHLTLPTILLV